MRLRPFALLFVATLVRASTHKVKESIDSHPRGWIRHSSAPADHLLQLKIALPQPHFSILEQHLWEVSDPEHERYGFHLSKDETDALMAPHPQSLDAVNKWLASHGIEEEHLYRSSAQDWITIRVSVALAEKMFATKYHVYVHSDSGDRIIRTTNYSLPESLYQHVEFVQPTTMFTRVKPFTSNLLWSKTAPLCSTDPLAGKITGPAGNQVDASCNSTITISCLRQLYNAIGYTPSARYGNRVAVTAYDQQYANNQDLQQFFKLENPQAYGSNYTFVSINGGANNQSSSTPEANLDTQFTFGLTYPASATFYSTGGSPPFTPDKFTPTNTNEPYADWLDYMLSQQHLPQAISTSYGDDEQTVPYNYAHRLCTGFAALGARGVSLLFASGDFGVGGNSSDPNNQGCYSNVGTNRTVFLPQFPATCPFVTSVGGTYLIPETAVDYSGGGFSNYFPRPPYQVAAVPKYLQDLAPGTYEGLYNPDGRGFPDVSAQGNAFRIILNGQEVLVYGTSCSTPTFVSFVSMLNDARLKAGRPPMGFLNPWLYSKGYAGLNDITSGNNPGCGTEGFNATVGWDPVTGLGTPNFEKLLALAMD